VTQNQDIYTHSKIPPRRIFLPRNNRTCPGEKIKYGVPIINKIYFKIIYKYSFICGSTQCRIWLRHCVTSRKDTGSISDGVTVIFHWHNPSGRTVTLGLNQWRTEGGLGGSNPPPRNSEAEPNSEIRGKLIRNNLIRIQVSLICKLSGTPD
jgi:hypothetical protein